MTRLLVIVNDEGHSGVSMFSHWTHALAELASAEVATTQCIARRMIEPNAGGATPSSQASPVTLSDGVVVLRPWRRSDAPFLHAASQDPAIEHFNGPTPEPIDGAAAVIEDIRERWRPFEVDGDPTGVALSRRYVAP
jgi:hypothetical protein